MNDSPPRTGMTRRPWRMAAALAALSLLPAACGDEAGSPAATQAPPPPAVTVVQVARSSVTPATEFLGRIEAVDRVDLRARVTGFLQERLFEEGQEVGEGDLLFVIEREPYLAEVRAREAAVASAEAQKAETAAQLARGEELLQNGNIPAAEVDQRRAADQMAAAAILEARAALEQARIQLGYTEIRAPITGKIGLAAFSVGNLVGPDSGVLASIVSQDPMYATFPVSVALILETQRESPTGQPDPSRFVARLRLPDGTTYRHPGRIDFLSNQVDRTTDTLAARAVVPNPERLLVDGQFVNVRVETAQPETALVIPQAAVLYDQGGSYVLAVADNGTVEVRRVVQGETQDTVVVVRDGLREGERIVVEGVQKVRPGMEVAATEVEPGALGAGQPAPEADGGARQPEGGAEGGGQAGSGG